MRIHAWKWSNGFEEVWCKPKVIIARFLLVHFVKQREGNVENHNGAYWVLHQNSSIGIIAVHLWFLLIYVHVNLPIWAERLLITWLYPCSFPKYTPRNRIHNIINIVGYLCITGGAFPMADRFRGGSSINSSSSGTGRILLEMRVPVDGGVSVTVEASGRAGVSASFSFRWRSL